ncbi:MAG: hypothetical protein KBT00_04545, partial [Bacteroidales bacterium]|nr:hypothetical protein [Candidatus Cacconaster merdequi]
IGSLVASLDGTEDRYALLSTDTDHTVKAPASGTTTLTLVYSPLLTEAPAVNEGAISISLANQNGTKAPFVAYATLDYIGTTITDALVPFKFATSVIRVNCTGLKAGTAIDNATLSNVNTACKLSLSGTAAPTVAGDVNGTITRTGDAYFEAKKVNIEGVAVFQMAVPVLEAASEARVLSISQGSANFKSKKFSKNSLKAATSVNTVCQFLTRPDGALPGKFSVADGKQVYFSQGNLWVDNSRALHFEDAQWGLPPIYEGSINKSHLSNFAWSNTISVLGTDDISGDYLFCDKDHKASVDGDAATYYALSRDEWQYLFSCHSYKWATVNGVIGYVIAPDGFDGTLSDSYVDDIALAADNLVFLPAAGIRIGAQIFFSGSCGYYLVSSYCKETETETHIMFFDNGNVLFEGDANPYGSNIRLVTDVTE